MKKLLRGFLQRALEGWLSLAFGVVVAARLFWAWGLGRLRRQAVRDAPPDCLHYPILGRHKFIKIENLKLHYVDAGHHDHPLLLMVHGAPDFWFTWRKQIPALSHDYRVVAVDLRGCGDSDTPRFRSRYSTPVLARDLATLVKLLGHRSAHLMCAGTGGHVGWYMCYHYPQLVQKMVLVHSPHPFVVRQYLHASWKNYYRAWFLFFARLPLLPEVAAHANDSGLVDQLLGNLLRGGALAEEEVEAYKFTFSRREDWTGPLHHLRQLDMGRVWEEEGVPGVITKPTLLLMGEDDPLLPIDTAYRSAEYVERITVKPVPGPGHLCHLSRAPQVNQAVGEFLRELSWRPLSPLEPAPRTSLVGRVMGASLAAVTRTTEATKSLPGGLFNAAQASFKAAESTLGLDNMY